MTDKEKVVAMLHGIGVGFSLLGGKYANELLLNVGRMNFIFKFNNNDKLTSIVVEND